MLYRHLPKIANKEFSIIAATFGSFRKETVDCPESLAAALVAQDVTLACLNGDEPGPIPPEFPGTILAVCPAGVAASFETLSKWVTERGVRPHDLLVADFTPDGAGTSRTGGIDPIRATLAGDSANRLVSEGLAGGFGFRLAFPAERAQAGAGGIPDSDRDAIAEIAAAGNWAFWSADYHLVNASTLDPLVRELGRVGIPLVATDPFAGGILSGVPANVHELFYNAPVPRAHEEWALRAIWENQDVLTVVAPASAISLLEKRCIFAGAGRPNSLPGRELEVIRAAAQKLLT